MMSEHRESRRDRLRSRIQESIEKAEEERKQELFRRRVELARSGVRAYQSRKITEAVTAFHTYLKILEDWKGVPEGGLGPTHFDRKKDLPELLLITGIYWDLAKLYDRTTSPAKNREFKHYLEKFVLFSRGMPYQSVSAETLRKYVGHERPVHREEFRNAHKALGGSDCFVVTALSDVTDRDTLPLLREFRDGVLLKSSIGREFVSWYYRNGPRLARATDRLPEPMRRRLGRALDRLARTL